MSDIRHVIFDMDGVLCDYDFDRRMQVMAERTGVPAADIKAKIFKSGFDDEADRGLHTADQYLQGMAARLGAVVRREDWIAARQSGMTPNGDVLDLAEHLAERVGIAMLTNNGPLLSEHLDEVFPEVAALFGERAFFSCQFGGGKEGTAVFGEVLGHIGGTPRSTLFIDDSAEYIANARAAGLHAHRFQGVDALRRALADFGLP